MKVLQEPCEGFFEAKGSKFLAFLSPCADIRAIRERQAQLRAQHPKSVHVVYAARALNEFGQIIEDFSDDGEPKGSSAVPALNALRGAAIVGAQLHIVRYFGGTLLGIGGLVRAYAAAANDAISRANLADWVAKNSYEISIEYADFRQFEYLAGGMKYEADFGEKISVKIELSEAEFAQLAEQIAQKIPSARLILRC